MLFSLLVEVDEASVEALMVKAGLLERGIECDRDQLAAALSRQVELLSLIED